jgi:Fur family transcriptional regulator, peroxide stress response regulator
VVSVRELFSKAGLRCTRQREQVYAALAATRAHPTAEDLFNAVRLVEPGLSLATVYNTLEVFTRRGLCRRLPASQGSAACRYDAEVADHVHLNLPDGRVLDLPQDLSDRFVRPISAELLAEVERRLGVRVGGVAVQVMCYDQPEPDQASALM